MRKIKITKRKELTKKQSVLLNIGTFILTTAVGVGIEEIIHSLIDVAFSIIKHLLGLQ